MFSLLNVLNISKYEFPMNHESTCQLSTKIFNDLGFSEVWGTRSSKCHPCLRQELIIRQNASLCDLLIFQALER